MSVELLKLPERRTSRPRTASRPPFWSANVYHSLRRLATSVVEEFLEAGNAVSHAYMHLLLLWDAGAGLLFMAGTWLVPQVGAYGVLAVISAYLFGRIAGVSRETWRSTNYLSSSLLVGLGLGAVLSLSWTGALFVTSLSILAFVLTVGLAHLFWTHLHLPVLTVPAVLCLIPAYAAIPLFEIESTNGFPTIAAWLFGLQFPSAVAGFLCSLGATLFVPHPLVGLLLALVLLARSRILLALGAAGYFLGTAVYRLLLESAPQVTIPACEFNFPLVAMALGGLFFVPSWRSYLIAAVGVVAAAVLMFVLSASWSASGVSPGFVPFNVVTLSFAYCLGLLKFSQVPRYAGKTPEETLQTDLALRWRFTSEWRTLRLPFYGTWTVWQEFDSSWTHQGAWKYAYDFVITDERGSTHAGSGSSLKDFYCYRRPVTSPVWGTVVKMVGDLPDNEPAQVNNEQNWGNLVVIYDDRGFYVQIAHFAQGSLRVTEGTRVEPGTTLGLCGNSGFSPQPHVHIQVQANWEITSPTVPFAFAGVVTNGTFDHSGRPPEGARVEPLVTDPLFEARCEFLLGDELSYSVLHSGKFIRTLTLKVSAALDGTLYFGSDRGGKLYFGKRDGVFTLYRVEGDDPHLSILLRALPRLPLTTIDDIDWSDCLPASLSLTDLGRAAVQLLSAFFPVADRMYCRLSRLNQDTIRCQSSSHWLPFREEAITTFDGQKGPASITLENWTLVRKNVHDAPVFLQTSTSSAKDLTCLTSSPS